MANWKTSVNPIYLPEHDTFDQICLYDTLTGQARMLSVRNVENPDDLWIGVAQQNGTDIIGVFATDQGPVFFVNKQRYLLNGNEWDFSVKQKNTQNNTFRFVYNKVVVYEANYKRVTELGVHPYADEEFMDFYTWMTKKKISKTFIQYYTE